MRHRFWMQLAGFAAVLSFAATVRADGRVLRVFTVDDLHRPTDGPDTPVTVTPLYGGSDRTAVAFQWQIDMQRDLTATDPPKPHPTYTAASVSFDPPAGNAGTVAGWVQLTISQFTGGNIIPGPTSKQPQVQLVVHGRPETAVWAPCFGGATTSDLHDFTAIRLPIPPGSAGPDGRVRVDVLVPADVGGVLLLSDLRLLGPGPATAPAAAVFGGPSPDWPPAGLSPHTLREFTGNDFDVRYGGSRSGVELAAPVEMSFAGSGTDTQAVDVAVHQPPAAGPRTVPVLALDDPGVTAGRYAVTGTAAYGGADGSESVDGFGYLELTSDFANGPPVVTRTLADRGVLRALRGRSGPRPFALPVDAGTRRPTRVQLALVISGTGKVELDDLKLVQCEPATRPVVTATGTSPAVRPWWTRDRVTARAVQLFGLTGGLAGGVVGCLAPVLVRRGRGRWVPVAFLVGIAVIGEAFFAWAMAVLGHGDGPAAWRPLLTAGLVGLCMPALIPVVTAGRREAELRRMRAADAVAA